MRGFRTRPDECPATCSKQKGEEVDVPELHDAGDGENLQRQGDTAHRRLGRRKMPAEGDFMESLADCHH